MSGGTSIGVRVGFAKPATAGSSVSTEIPPSAVTVPWFETLAGPVYGLSTVTWKVIVTDWPAGSVPTFQVMLSPTTTGGVGLIGLVGGFVDCFDIFDASISVCPSTPLVTINFCAFFSATLAVSSRGDETNGRLVMLSVVAAGCAGAVWSAVACGCSVACSGFAMKSLGSGAGGGVAHATPKVGVPLTVTLATSTAGLAAAIAAALACSMLNVPFVSLISIMAVAGTVFPVTS